VNIAFDRDGIRFNCRVAGVCIHDGHVLLLQWASVEFWALPGGRAQLLEPSRDALAREMAEEMDLPVEVGPLIWVVENFFTYEGLRFHELSFVYRFFLPDDCPYLDVNREFTGWEETVPITFRWFPVDQLAGVTLYPSFLRTALADLPDQTVHVVHVDG
jgi:8-oxo-dGTP pyrophosphatase MutT (NUDIX family)